MLVRHLSFDIKYRVNGQQFHTVEPEKDTEHFTLDVQGDGEFLKVKLCPKTAVEFDKFAVKYPHAFKDEERIFVNGYESWTDSLEYRPDGQMKELSKLTEFMVLHTPLHNIGFSKSGDNDFHKFPRIPGFFYGWSYGYIRVGNNLELFGSLSERSGYTIVNFDANNDVIVVEKELEGVTYTEDTELLSFVHIRDEYDPAFDKYFDMMGVKSRENKKRVGYTTWYNYYGNVNSNDVYRDLDSISKLDTKVDCFQIDDGYQTAIGDWLSTDKKKFPDGMKAVADAIHANGMEAGLWLAPFAGVKKSEVFKAYPDWFIKDKNGNPYNTGHNWGGFYSLDIYNEEVRAHLKHVFDVVLNEWGYDLVKLDFLYGACVLPMHNKSRGEIMCDAMDLLRECCGDKLILGCGVPLMPAFGKVDYCRIGPDIGLNWRKQKHAIREEVSTPHAMCNTIFRRHLDGRAWMNDPDVFLLRDTNIKMDFEQRKMTAKVNSIFGSLLFVSDNVAEYNEAQRAVLDKNFSKKEYKVTRAEFVAENIMEFDYVSGDKEKRIRFNVNTGAKC